jgi:hypothetical protein
MVYTFGEQHQTQLCSRLTHLHRAYEVAKQYLGLTDTQPDGLLGPNSLRLMLAGGIAGVCSWASVYPFGKQASG